MLGATPPAGVEVVRRRGADSQYLFVLNHGDRTVVLSGSGTDLLTESRTTDGLVIAVGGAAVVREDTGVSQWTVESA